MNTQDQYDQEFNELKEYIETFITTAKLIGHKVSHNSRKTIIYIKGKDKTTLFMKIAIVSTKDSPILQTTYKGQNKTFKYLPHQTKLDHLKGLLETL